METSKGEDHPPVPSRPGVGRSPADRPKIAPRVPAKPQPPLPKRPPVASKPSAGINGVQSDTGAPKFSKTPPPLPSVPPCGSQRERPTQPVPAPRRISQVLRDSDPVLESSPGQVQPTPTNKPDGPVADPSSADPAQQKPASEEGEQQTAALTEQPSGVIKPKEDNVPELKVQSSEVSKLESRTPISPQSHVNKITMPQPVVPGRGRPKPPVKPKPKVKAKPLYSVVQKDKPAAASESEVEKIPEPEKAPDVVTAEQPDMKAKPLYSIVQKDKPAATNEPKVEKIPEPENAPDVVTAKQDIKEETDNKTGTVTEEQPVINLKSEAETTYNSSMNTSQASKDTKDKEPVTTNDSLNGVDVQQGVSESRSLDSLLSSTLAKSDSFDTPKRPPRKKKMDKSFSQGSIDAECNDDTCAKTMSEDTKASKKELKKQENMDEVSAEPDESEVKQSPKIKRRPSRVAPPPPPLSVPEQSVELTRAEQDKPEHGTPDKQTSDGGATAAVSIEKTVKVAQKRDSFPQPGRLNIKSLEASMAMSIGKGLHHQMTGKTRPKPKPKPPLLTPKPKVAKPLEKEDTLGNKQCPEEVSSDKGDSQKFCRTPSYSEATESPTLQKESPKVFEKDAKDPEKKFKRNPSYSQALDDLDKDEGTTERENVSIADATITSSSDAAETKPSSELQSQRRKPGIPGMVRVLPIDFSLSKLKMPKSTVDTDTTEPDEKSVSKNVQRDRRRSRTLDDKEIEAGGSIRRSQTVEALLDVENGDTNNESPAEHTGPMKKANSAGDILENKTGTMKGEKPNFVPPPPPPYSELVLAQEAALKTKAMQFPSVDEDGSNEQSVKRSVDLDDQVFVEDDGARQKNGDISSDDDYEPIEIQRHLDLSDNDSDHPDHIYEPIPPIPPKTSPKITSNTIDIPPVRPPKRPRALRAPPLPPSRSPPTTPMASQDGLNFGSPPLPPRTRNSPIRSRSPADMYDRDGYLEPLRHPDTGEIYSYADVPDYPFEKKKTPVKKPPKERLSTPPRTPPRRRKSPEPVLRQESKTPVSRESVVSVTSVRTSGGSHIYEPIGSLSGSLNRENPHQAAPEQRISGRSTFYFDINDEAQAQRESTSEQNGKEDAVAGSRLAGGDQVGVGIMESKAEPQDPELDSPIPPPPQAPPRLKRMKLKASSMSIDIPRKSISESSESDDYIYPDDPDMVSPENSMYQKDGDCSKDADGSFDVADQTSEAIYHEADEPTADSEASHHEADKPNTDTEDNPPVVDKHNIDTEAIYHEADELDIDTEAIYHEADKPDVDTEAIYNEADDEAAADCQSESTSGFVSPSTPPPVPPRDHHKSEPVPQAIRQALNLQRQASALSDTNIILDKKLKVVPKSVSFESQQTDSALSLSPCSEDMQSPTDKMAPPRMLKQRSLSNPVVNRNRKRSDSLQEDSASTSSDRPSSWASSCDGFEEQTPVRRRRRSEDNASIASSLHPGSMFFSHGSGSSLNTEPSDLSDNELEEWHKEKEEKRKRKISNIAREITTSEETFVDVLKLLNIDFRLAMAKATEAHEHTIVPPAVMNQILQYLPQVQNFNEELLRDLKARIDNWENDPRVGDIFVRKGPFLKMYTFYIREFENSMTALDEARKKYSEFDTAVKEFEASPRCRNLLLKHYMLKPIQRIPQYRLLLQEYQKYLTPEHIDYKDTQAALVIVSEVADHANQSMKYGDNFKKLWEIQSSLIGQFEVIKPGREFIKEGLLNKLSRKVMQPRMFFLFSDVLLYTTPVSGGYKLNNHIPLTGVRVSLPTKEDFQNEVSILSAQRSFTISASTAQERDEWLSTLQGAIKENAKRRSSFDVRKLHKIPSVLVEVEKDLTLGSRAPVWVPDARVSMCMLCTAEFHVTFRRHHCRACGKVVCGYCSDYRAPIRYLKYKAARVCVECYRKLSKEFDEDGMPELPTIVDESEKDSPFSRASIKARFRGISWGSYRKASKAKRPAVLQEVSANDDIAEMSGYLKVWKNRKWKKLWFVLKGKALYTFKASEDTAAIESTVLLGYEVQNFDSWFEGVEPSLVFEIRHVGTAAMVFRTESPASRDKWLNAIREATVP